YNEWAQVLETVNPDTGELYQPEDFAVIAYQDTPRRHAAGRDLGRHRSARGGGLRRHDRRAAQGGHPRLGVRARRGRVGRRDHARGGLDLGPEPRAVDGERDQQAHLARAERRRRRRRGRAGADGGRRAGRGQRAGPAPHHVRAARHRVLQHLHPAGGPPALRRRPDPRLVPADRGPPRRGRQLAAHRGRAGTLPARPRPRAWWHPGPLAPKEQRMTDVSTPTTTGSTEGGTAEGVDLDAWALELDRSHVFHSWSAQASLAPVSIAGGSGTTVWDHGGRRYLDFSSQLVNVNIGHSHPRLVAAIQEQAATLATIGPATANLT